jgi:hypothetical protein
MPTRSGLLYLLAGTLSLSLLAGCPVRALEPRRHRLPLGLVIPRG